MDKDEQRPDVILYATIALPLGLCGLVGAAIWFLRNRHLQSAAFGAGFVNLGAGLLALAALILLLWGAIVLVGFKKEADEEDEEF